MVDGSAENNQLSTGPGNPSHGTAHASPSDGQLKDDKAGGGLIVNAFIAASAPVSEALERTQAQAEVVWPSHGTVPAAPNEHPLPFSPIADGINPAAQRAAGTDDAAAAGSSGMGSAAGVPTMVTKSTGRRRKPTAIAMAASEQALEGEKAKAKGRQRKRSADTVGVSRTQHGGVKIGGRAVTWVGGAGMAREVCCLSAVGHRFVSLSSACAANIQCSSCMKLDKAHSAAVGHELFVIACLFAHRSVSRLEECNNERCHARSFLHVRQCSVFPNSISLFAEKHMKVEGLSDVICLR
jgi:hypothetical protein